MTEETITSADQLDAMLLDEQITQEQYDELRQALESPPPPPQPEGGAATASDGPQPRLHKSWSPRLLGGVCGGLANHMGMSPDLVRILAIAALLVAPPVTLIVYFACYFLLPWDDREAAREPQEKGHPWRFAGILTGMCLIQFLFSQFAARQFVKIFEDLAAELPYLTRIALLISDVSTSILGVFGQIILIAFLTGIYLIIHKPKLRLVYFVSLIFLYLFLFVFIVAAYFIPLFGMAEAIQ